MPDIDLLAPLTEAVHATGRIMAGRPVPPPARDLAGFRVSFAELERPAAAALEARLAELRPGVARVDELDARLPATGEVWVADVTDGAVQLVQGLPQWCVSVALVRDGQPVVAVLHSPGLGETYTAIAGHGAHRDGRPIAPSVKTDPAVAVVATSQPPFAGHQPAAVRQAGRSLSAVLPDVAAVRNLGPTSWQVADTAAGRLDAFWEYGRDEVNLLAGALIAREAGALVTDAEGRPWRPGADSFLAAGPGLHAALRGLLAERP